MLSKNILIGMLVSLFCLGLSGTVFSEDIGDPNSSIGDRATPMDMESDYIEFDYSPRESSSLASVPFMNMGSDVIEFDYSPRDHTQSATVLHPVNTESADIQFDYSPRPLNCGAPYC